MGMDWGILMEWLIWVGVGWQMWMRVVDMDGNGEYCTVFETGEVLFFVSIQHDQL